MSQDQGIGLQFEPEERLPWLEPVEDMPQSENMLVRLIGLVVAGLVIIGAVVGGLWWWQNNAAGGRGELIAAAEGPYKVEPKAEPGRFDGDGTIAVAAAEGQQTISSIDASRLPEQPVPPSAAASTPKAAPPATPAPKTAVRSTATPAPAAAAPTAAATGTGMVQIGAFSSEAAASRAWDTLKTRFEWLAPVNRSIVPAEVNGRTVYRLRAAAGTTSAARTLCNRLRVAGENCNPI